MINPIYKGSVKDVRGPVAAGGTQAVVFDYSNSFSVFDWGRMPDALPNKGAALATLAADWFAKLEQPQNWKEFSRTQTALGLRKGNRFGAAFNELGERLQTQGLRTHFLGVLEKTPVDEGGLIPQVAPLDPLQAKGPIKHFVVKQVSIVKPEYAHVLGRTLPDYLQTRKSPSPRLVPLEVVFRFSCPEGSSLLERVARDPQYLASLGFSHEKVEAGAHWDFPVLELFTKLETVDRPLSLGEALAISGLSGAQLQDLLLRTAWVAGFLKAICLSAGLELADGKLEWGVSDQGELFLVDAVGPDELRILKDGVQLSKEFFREYYKNSTWYESVGRAKEHAQKQGVAEWKRFVGENPPHLSPQHMELGSQLYMALTNALTGRRWFENAWALEKVVDGIRGLKG